MPLPATPQRRSQASYRRQPHAVATGGQPHVPRYAAWCAVALSVGISGDVAATETLQHWRSAFQNAEQNLAAGLDSDYHALRHYPLYPYLRYQHLTRHLAAANPAEVRAFLDSYPATPWATRLRTAWLRHLAQQERWTDYLQVAQPSNDVQLECWRRQALLHTGQPAAALQHFTSLWLRGSALPAACDPLLAQWQTQDQPSAELRWQRFALAMGNGELKLARYLRGTLPAADGAWAEAWLAVAERPESLLHLERLQGGDATRLAPLLADGLKRWMRRDALAAADAADLWQQRDPHLLAALAETQRQLALWLASDYHPTALARLQALPEALVNQEVREWRIRLHLRLADWAAVLREIESLPPAHAADLRWQYWRARALEGLGRVAEARPIYVHVAGHRDYHGFLAADRLGSAYTMTNVPLHVAPQTLAALLDATPGLQRAREWYVLGREAEAEGEWRAALRNADSAALRHAALLAQAWGWRYQALTTIARAGYWDDLQLRFPLDYRDLVLASSNADAPWVYAVIRQESNFRVDARSPVGALGLMQIMPATGQQIARDLQDPAPPDLLRPATNIRYGAYYLQQIAQRLQNNPMLATAAYNAGPNKVLQWLPSSPLAADVWVETIPYRETRGYVQRVMEYAAVYGYLLEVQAAQRPLGTRMKTVLPVASQS